MNRTIKEATVKRYHYDSHEQLSTHLADFMAAYNFARRLLAHEDCSLDLKNDIAVVFEAVLRLAIRQNALHLNLVHRTAAGTG